MVQGAPARDGSRSVGRGENCHWQRSRAEAASLQPRGGAPNAGPMSRRTRSRAVGRTLRASLRVRRRTGDRQPSDPSSRARAPTGSRRTSRLSPIAPGSDCVSAHPRARTRRCEAGARNGSSCAVCAGSVCSVRMQKEEQVEKNNDARRPRTLNRRTAMTTGESTLKLH